MATAYLTYGFNMLNMPEDDNSLLSTLVSAHEIQWRGNAWSMGVRGTFTEVSSGPLAFTGPVTHLFLTNSQTEIIPPLVIDGINLQMTVGMFNQAQAGEYYYVVQWALGGNDTVYGSSGGETLIGFSGNDTLIGREGADRLYGFSGSDTASYVTSGAFVVVSLIDNVGAGGDAQGDTFNNVENLTGSRFGDALLGNDAVNVINGGAGNDALTGYGGADILNGGAGIDTVEYVAAVRVSLLTPSLNTGEAKGDRFISIENLTGGGRGDTLYGNNAANIIKGNGSVDDPTEFDADKLFGMGGNDQLFGGWGTDTLTGGLGKDRLSGGGSRDIYDFNTIAESVVGSNRDVIMDFVRGNNVTGDDIDLSTIDARTTAAGNQGFVWLGTRAFTKVAGQLRFTDLASTCLVQGDVNGDGKADFEIEVRVATLGAGDFIL